VHIQSRSSSIGLDVRICYIGSEEKEAVDLPLRFYDKDNYIAFEQDKLVGPSMAVSSVH
jgi:hypothetical protein